MRRLDNRIEGSVIGSFSSHRRIIAGEESREAKEIQGGPGLLVRLEERIRERYFRVDLAPESKTEITLYSDGELSVVGRAGSVGDLIICETGSLVEGARVWIRACRGDEEGVFGLTDTEGRFRSHDGSGGLQGPMEARVRWLQRSGNRKSEIVSAAQIDGVFFALVEAKDGREKREVVLLYDEVEAFIEGRGEEVWVTLVSSEYVTAGVELAIGILADGHRQLLHRGRTGTAGSWRIRLREGRSHIAAGAIVELVLFSQPEPVG